MLHDVPRGGVDSNYGYLRKRWNVGKAFIEDANALRVSVPINQMLIWYNTNKLLEPGLSTSHLCHYPVCTNGEHIYCEDHNRNVKRTTCEWVKITVQGNKLTVELTCKCEPKCRYKGKAAKWNIVEIKEVSK